MSKFLDYLYLTLVTAVILGGCVYLEKKNSEDYKACLLKAKNVVECEAIKN